MTSYSMLFLESMCAELSRNGIGIKESILHATKYLVAKLELTETAISQNQFSYT